MNTYFRAKYDPWLQTVVGGVPGLLTALGGNLVATGQYGGKTSV